MKPKRGEVVDYRLTADDVKTIEAAREAGKSHGNHPRRGDIFPLIVVRVWPDEYDPTSTFVRGPEEVVFHPESPYGVNGQAILDGDDTIWVTTAPQGEFPGCWQFPRNDS